MTTRPILQTDGAPREVERKSAPEEQRGSDVRLARALPEWDLLPSDILIRRRKKPSPV